MSPRSIPARARVSAIDIGFGLVVAGTWVAYVRWSKGFGFVLDDWPLARRGWSAGDFLEPYNKHLSITIIAIYRSLYQVFGFDTYLPWRIVGITTLLAVPVALYLVFRTRVGPLIAALVASYFLWFPGTKFDPSQMNHFMAVLGGIVCAWALTRSDRKSDAVVGAALAFSLLAAGGGLAVIAGCVVHAACTRARFARWIAIAVPSGLWGIWFLAYSRNDADARLPLDTTDLIRKVSEGVLATFDALAFDNRILGVLLAIAFAIHLVWRIRQGLAAAANAIAWSTALLAWWAGLAYSRGALVDADNFRYVYVGAAFVVLAMIPPKRLKVPDATRSLAAAVAALVAIGGIALLHRQEILEGAVRTRHVTRSAVTLATIANMGPAVAPDADRVPRPIGLTGEEYRDVVDRWGAMPGTERPRDLDQFVVAEHPIALEPAQVPQPCTAPNPIVRSGSSVAALVYTASEPTTVVVRRFGDRPVAVGDVAANRAAVLRLPALGSVLPWEIGAPGACILALDGLGG